MKRVMLVNKFLHHVGGVETYLAWQVHALQAHGYEVAVFGMEPPLERRPVVEGVPTFQAPHREYNGKRTTAAWGALNAVHSLSVHRAFDAAVRIFEPDLVHHHMTAYQLTPAVIRVAEAHGLPSVVTAHEYKLACANQRLWDDGLQEECVRCIPRRGVGRSAAILQQRCVKGSAVASVVAAIEQPYSDRSWLRSSATIHCPSQHMMRVLHRAGWPSSRLFYLDLPWDAIPASDATSRQRTDVVFIGRLAVEKGADILLQAWGKVQAALPELRLVLAGDGIHRQQLERLVDTRKLERVHFLGRYEPEALTRILDQAVVTVHPSIWQENSPFTVRESLTRGVPAIVSNKGGLPEMVSSATGAVFPSGDPAALAEAILHEARVRRAGSATLQDAVLKRAITPGDHLAKLAARYDAAMGR